MEVNCIDELVFVAESACADFDRLDATANAFCRAITDLQNDGVDDAPQVILDGFGGSLKGSSRQRIAQLSQGFQPLSAQVRLT